MRNLESTIWLKGSIISSIEYAASMAEDVFTILTERVVIERPDPYSFG